MHKSLHSLGLTEFGNLSQQIDDALNSVRSVIDRELFSAKRYADQFREMASGAGIARRALEDLQRHEHSASALAQEAARLDWSNQLANLERISSQFASNEVLNQVTEQSRRLTEVHDVVRLANSQSAFEHILDHARELATGSSLQRMLEEEAKRLQRALAPMHDFGALESAAPQLQEMLNRERRQWEAMIAQVAGPAGLSLGNDVSRLHEEIARRASKLPQFEQFIQDAIRIAERFQVETWSPATVRSVLDAVRWDEVFSVAHARTEPPGAKRSMRKATRRTGERRRLTRDDLLLCLAVLSLILGIIDTLFESGLIQRFDARDPPATPVPVAYQRVERWAITTLPTTLFSNASAQAATLVRVPAGAWLRVLEHRSQWLLVEVETGERSRLQGWMRTLASRDLQEEVWQQGLQALGDCTDACTGGTSLAALDVPEVVRNAGDDARIAYAAALASLRSTSTRAAYERAFTRFFGFCSGAGIALPNLTAIDVIAYVTSVSQQDSVATAKQHLIALRKLFNHFQAADVVAANPTAGLKSPKPSSQRAVTVDGKNVERLLQALAGTKEAEVRDRAIVALIAGLGFKVSQLTALTIDAVEDAGDARLQLRLGPRRQRIGVPAVANEALEAYVSLRRVASPPDAPLFVSTRSDNKGGGGGRALARGEIYAMLKRRAEACGIPEISCEGLRHALR